MPTLNRENFERLDAYRRAHGLANWDQALAPHLPAFEKVEAPV